MIELTGKIEKVCLRCGVLAVRIHLDQPQNRVIQEALRAAEEEFIDNGHTLRFGFRVHPEDPPEKPQDIFAVEFWLDGVENKSGSFLFNSVETPIVIKVDPNNHVISFQEVGKS